MTSSFGFGTTDHDGTRIAHTRGGKSSGQGDGIRPLGYLLLIHHNRRHTQGGIVEWRIELIYVPVTDVDLAKAFYADRVGFVVDHDVRVSEEVRFVQLTPPGSACSIAIGEGLTDMAPGSQNGIQVVVPDADAARAHLLDRGIDASEVDEQPWGRFVGFADPDGNAWVLQQ